MTSDTEMECAVIGGIISDGICSTLADESFTALITLDFDDIHCRRAFGVLVDMYKEKREINPISVRDAMERSGVQPDEAASQVRQFMDACGAPWMASEYVKIVRRNGHLRAIKREIMRLKPDVTAQDIGVLIDLINKRDNSEKSSVVSTADCMDEYVDSLFNTKAVKINSGFPTLDNNLHAQPGDLVVVGARTNVGKTAFLVNVLHTMLQDGLPCLYIPTEMKPAQFMSRLMPLMTNVYANRFRSLELDDEHKAQIRAAAERVKGMPLTVLDIASPNIEEIRAAVRTKGCQVLFVDYLGRCSMTREATRMREVEKFVVALKTLCVDRGIICFLAVQLGRTTDHNTDTPPLLADLADSSAIEKEADLVLMLWKDRNKKGLTYSESIISAMIAKNRHGYITDFDIRFNKNQMRMSEASGAPAFGGAKVEDAGE